MIAPFALRHSAKATVSVELVVAAVPHPERTRTTAHKANIHHVFLFIIDNRIII